MRNRFVANILISITAMLNFVMYLKAKLKICVYTYVINLRRFVRLEMILTLMENTENLNKARCYKINLPIPYAVCLCGHRMPEAKYMRLFKKTPEVLLHRGYLCKATGTRRVILLCVQFDGNAPRDHAFSLVIYAYLYTNFWVYSWNHSDQIRLWLLIYSVSIFAFILELFPGVYFTILKKVKVWSGI